MGATEPGQVIEIWMKLFNSGDIDGLVADMYEDGIVLVPGPGTPAVTGKDAVREVLQGFAAMKGTMSLVGAETLVCGEIALCHDHWKLDVPDSDPLEGTTADVVRRQPDGSWKYVIDNPFGGAIVGATA